MNSNKYDVIVVGGGLFGVTTALKLAKDRKVVLIERNKDILQESSYVNQNRIHHGFHYPRSLETAYESLAGLELLKERFGKHMRSFESYYAIVSEGSLTSPQDFIKFANTLRDARGVNYKIANVDQWFLKPRAVSVLLETHEPVMDMAAVREDLKKEIAATKNLTLVTDAAAQALEKEAPFVVRTTRGKFEADYLVNASFGNLCWHDHPKAPRVEIQYVEMVELESQKEIPGLTLMDGPTCFGILPIGFSKTRYWWYSVAYSVHTRVETKSDIKFRPPFYTNWTRMKEQGESIFTFMSDLKYVRSHFTPRTLIVDARIDQTAARPSVVSTLTPGFFQVLSGKLTTCMAVANEVARRIEEGDQAGDNLAGDGTHILKRAA